MKFALLASGSKGNSCVIKHEDTQIIIDCGTTKKYLTSCYEQLQYEYESTDALLVTHTHKDHVSQIKMFDQIPTYACAELETSHLTHVNPFDQFALKDLKITVLPMSHDCEGTVGFVLENAQEKLVYMTDTGYVKNEVKPYIENADYYIFESNHDIEMLMQTTRPVYIKQRIINDNGHLCNSDAAEILTQVMGQKTKEIILAHISQEGNTRGMAVETLQKTFQRKSLPANQIRVYPAEQYGIYIGGNKK